MRRVHGQMDAPLTNAPSETHSVVAGVLPARVGARRTARVVACGLCLRLVNSPQRGAEIGRNRDNTSTLQTMRAMRAICFFADARSQRSVTTSMDTACLCRDPGGTLLDVALEVGCATPSAFSDLYRRMTGESP